MDTDRLREIESEKPALKTGTDLVVLPKELEGAPEEIKSVYLKWLDMDNQIAANQRRYFEFVSETDGNSYQVDGMWFQGQAVKKAKEKGIGKSDLTRLEGVCKEMEALKKQKTRLKLRWLAYVRPKMGKGVFDWRKAEIIEQFARYATYEEVKRWLEGEGYAVELGPIYKFFLNNKDTIDKKRLEFIRSSKDHYLATDAGRMETLAMLHARFVHLFNEAYKAVANNTQVSAQAKEELRALSREIRGIIEQARKEIKGEEIRLTVDGRIDINASLQAALTIQDISKKIPINIIPVYLVAAKMGIDPGQIITSLVSSFYKDFNGFSKLDTTTTPPTTLDLIRNYDWNEIAKFQNDKKTQSIETVPFEDIPSTEKAKVQTKRQKLLDLINKQVVENPEGE